MEQVREKIKAILLEASKRTVYYWDDSQDQHHIDTEWTEEHICEVADQILALFPDGCASCDTPLLREGELYQMLKDAKQSGYTKGYEQAVREFRATTIDDPGPWGD